MQDALQQVDDGRGGFGMKDMENELRVLEDRLDAEDDDELFCVACDKEMRNEKAFASHRKQKKHLENVERLRETLLKDELISSDDLKDDSDTEAQKEETMITAEVNETKDAPSSEKLEGEEDVLKNNKSAKRKTKSKRNKNSKTVPNKDDSDNEAQEEEETTIIAEVNETKDTPSSKKLKDEEDVMQNNKSAKRKTKLKRTKNSKTVPNSTVDLNTDLGCAVCKKEFPSKNKLFRHLKETGHSVALS